MFFQNKYTKLILVIIVFTIFIYLRLQPIFLQKIPYTFDQGRDFLKVEEIVKYKNLTFIGPTTGAPGVYHGPWWYYMLAIPYIFFNGAPVGFALFIFFINLLTTYLFYRFLNKEFNFLTALFFLLIASVSPYLIFMSFFVISSTPELPLFLLLLFLTYKLFKKPSLFIQLLIFFTLGFILEQEIPPGLFLIPSYFAALIITKQIKKFSFNQKHVLYSFVSFIIASLPRIIFEIKHNFIQTKAALSYISQTKSDINPALFLHTIVERLQIFESFYKSLFINNDQILAILSLIIFTAGLIFVYKKFNPLKKTYFLFLSLVIFIIFLLTCLYKKEVWGTYLEGLPYFYLTLLSIIFYGISKNKHKFQLVSVLIILILFIINLNEAYTVLTTKKNIEKNGLEVQIQKVNYLYKENNNKDFCVRIYTPPVIPHTYNYLFSYLGKIKNYKSPSNDFVDNKCWYIIEEEQKGELYQQRITKWKKENIPKQSKLLKNEFFEDGTLIELREKV